MPDWQLTPEEEEFGDAPVDANSFQPLDDENGNPLPQPIPQQPGAPPPMVRPDGTGDPSQQQLDQAFPPAQPRPRPQPQPDQSAPPPEPTEPRPYAP
jgi:hypothetical protein